MKLVKVGADLSPDGRCEFTVWSPLASSVDIRIVKPAEFLVKMDRGADGYWRKTLDGIGRGSVYYYVIDGTLERPDPASHIQPEGVHGPSGVVDHISFSWNSPEWRPPPLEDMIIYEIHTGTFTSEGTFDAVIPILPELKELGITTIELMPVAQFPGTRNWGYDGVYPYAVQNSYGGPEGLKRLCNACHDLGLAVFLDVVYNHLGPEGNYLHAYGPYFTDKYRTPWGDAVNFDCEYSDGVRNFFIMNALHWFENYHIDGLRLDAVHGIYDFSAKHILEELADHVKTFCAEKGGQYYLTAESDLNDSRIVSEKNYGGYGIDAQWSDDFHHAVHTLLTGEKNGYYVDFGEPAQLAKVFTEGYVYSGEYSDFRKRRHGNSPAEIAGCKMIVFIQDHDQTGNRMKGERITALAGFEAHKLAAGTLLTAPYIPLLFMGEEYADDAPFLYFISHGDPDLVESVRNGRKREFASFGWDDEPPDPYSINTFKLSRPDRNLKCRIDHQAMFSYYKELIKIRKEIPSLKKLLKNNVKSTFCENGHVFSVTRVYDDSKVCALMNYSAMEAVCTAVIEGEIYEKIIDSADVKWQGPGSSAPPVISSRTRIVLRPFNFVIYRMAGAA